MKLPDPSATAAWPAAIVRLLPLVAAVGYVALVMANPNSITWSTAVGAGMLAILGYRFPLSVVVGQSTILIAGELLDSTPLVPVKVLLVLSLIELVYRRGRRSTIAGAAVATVTYVILHYATVYSDRSIGGLAYALLGVVAAPVFLGLFLRSTKESLDVAQERATEAELRQELETEAARVHERTAIARELHDVIAHHVASIALRVGVAVDVLDDLAPPARAVLTDVQRQASAALSDLRGLIGVLRDPDMSAGAGIIEVTDLVGAIGTALETGRRAGLQIDDEVDHRIGQVDAIRGLCVLRLVQEGVTNAARHGAPDGAVHVRVTREADASFVTIANSCTPTPDRRHRAGFGLIGLRERVAALDGTLSAGPDSDGWKMTAYLPDGTAAPTAPTVLAAS
ncbi:two-component sensor histidine kinase [Epidermidibacterium keratini]|uniref:histidine kinase n=1 Tax=Epidermidibacterium keratini TaxID=1891644 RepID=A0A7L4YN85_9ACTN|nr:histidine kinase [Epidermidibacterium keratini]QHC00538.1 two-component sensor histidine kinase [Epidermidibacterium keratini]